MANAILNFHFDFLHPSLRRRRGICLPSLRQSPKRRPEVTLFMPSTKHWGRSQGRIWLRSVWLWDFPIRETRLSLWKGSRRPQEKCLKTPYFFTVHGCDLIGQAVVPSEIIWKSSATTSSRIIGQVYISILYPDARMSIVYISDALENFDHFCLGTAILLGKYPIDCTWLMFCWDSCLCWDESFQ